MIDFSKLGKELYFGLCKYSPEILTGIGIAGMITATVLAVKATPKAIQLLDEKKEELETEKIPVGETVKTTWKCYLPTVVLTSISAGCIIFADRQHIKRNAALATAWSLSESAFQTYKDKVIETIGDKKEKQIENEIATDTMKAHPAAQVYYIDPGKTRFYETMTNHEFVMDINDIGKIEVWMSKKLGDEMFVSLNELLDEIGLDRVEDGDERGWNSDDVPFEFSKSYGAAKNGEPCIILSAPTKPRFDYRKLL